MLTSMSEARDQIWFSGHTHLKISWMKHHINQRDGVVSYPPPPFHEQSDPSSPPSSPGSKISPAVLIIIVILAVLFFISGLLHLLVRFLMKHPSPSSQSNERNHEVSSSDDLQRQLQQLFHLHDSGLDQAFIDALPVFLYKEIVGAKEPFDCPVCLCEFSAKDELRLLPTCSHAFHINCIDTWLLSNSTCPLCRGALFNPSLSIENPMFGFDDLVEDDGFPNRESGFVPSQKRIEREEIVIEKGVFPVRLGKFRRLDDGRVDEAGVGETSSSNLDARRCFSMGSYQYVVRDTDLRVSLNHDRDGRHAKLMKGIEDRNKSPVVDGDMEGKKITIGSRTDSYSVSKIWLWSKKGRFGTSWETQ